MDDPVRWRGGGSHGAHDGIRLGDLQLSNLTRMLHMSMVVSARNGSTIVGTALTRTQALLAVPPYNDPHYDITCSFMH